MALPEKLDLGEVTNGDGEPLDEGYITFGEDGDIQVSGPDAVAVATEIVRRWDACGADADLAAGYQEALHRAEEALKSCRGALLMAIGASHNMSPAYNQALDRAHGAACKVLNRE